MLKKTIAFIVMFFTVSLSLLILGGCNKILEEKEETVSKEINNTSNWYDKYNLDSKEVIIYIDNKETPEKNYTLGDRFTIIKITTPEEIVSLANSVNFTRWEKWQGDFSKYDGLNYYYVQFNEQTTIGLYQDIAYGDISKGPLMIGDFKENELKLDNFGGYFDMPEEFLQTVQQLVEKHTAPTG